ncbi:MAG: hypothetical protein M1823_002472 [Watsoniomyces obsoletus]|nr:MAG: hypothetical protein M1823_002472 [Watsoniomyces obsoletus]
MSFFTTWFPSNQIVIVCFDTPQVFQKRLQSVLQQQQGSVNYPDPYVFQVLIIDEIINLHDQSIWSIRDHTRALEKVRCQNRKPEPNNLLMHEIARHAIHSFETMDVAVHTVLAMHEQYRRILQTSMESGHRNMTESRSTEKNMAFQVQMLQNLRSRSEANAKRIQNEIALAYHSVAGRDSETMVHVGQATRRDSAAMRIVAVVSMAFLPAMFLSSLFSTSFFDFTPGNDGRSENWSMSSKIWLYWALVVPLTAGTIGAWYIWQQLSRH